MSKVNNIPIESIKPDPDQPRKLKDPKHIRGLAESIKIEGIINPIEVDEDLMIITGECRWLAAKEAGWKEVPAIMRKKAISKYERFRRQMAENLHQSSAGSVAPMNAKDVARGYRTMLEMKGRWRSGAEHPPYEDVGISELARDLAVSKSHVSSYLSLLDEPENVLEEISKGRPHSYYTEMRGIPEKYKEGLREAVAENKIPSSKIIRRFRQIARVEPNKADLLYLRLTEKQSAAVNNILNCAVELSFALKRVRANELSQYDRSMVRKNLISTRQSIASFLGKLKKVGD
jgi:hypothetical protein